MPTTDSPSEPLPAQLGLFDGVSIIVGIVVGVAIFKTPQLIFANVAGPWQLMGVWLLGGLLSLVGALCYAELATTYPRSGGDYVYLTRAYGSWVGFLFGWAQLVVLLTGSGIGAMAYAFSDYTVALFAQTDAHAAQLSRHWGVWFAVGAVAVLTLMNLCGVILGKATQNVLTVAKILGVGGIIVSGLLWGGTASVTASQPMAGTGFGLAMVFVLYAYGGWNDTAFVASEIRQQRRNLPLALLLGIGGITLIYLLVNAAYLWGLGFEGVRESSAPAADVLKTVLGQKSSQVMSLLVMISALGAINGLIFTGSRVYATVGADHSVFALLSHWHPTRVAPVYSLLAQAAASIVLIVAVGTIAGQRTIDAALVGVALSPLPWQEYFGGFNTLVAGTAPVFWTFFLLTGLSVFVLRWKDGPIERPFSVPWFPVPPLLFCGTCVYMLYSAVVYAKALTLLGVAPVILGLPVYVLSRRRPPAGR